MLYFDQRQVCFMKSEVRIFPYPDGEHQRVQMVYPEDWSELELLRPEPSEKAFDCFHHIYKQYLVPAAPWVFGSLVMFRLPEGVEQPYSYTGRYGAVADPLTAAAIGLRRGVQIMGEQIRFRDEKTRVFWNQLEATDSIRIVRGKLPITTIIPVGKEAGFLTRTEPEAGMKVNGSFFIMDPFDCATPYDHIGANFGLFVKDGVVAHPPLFSREALLVRHDGTVTIEQPEITNLQVQVGGEVFTHGTNAHFYSRPHRSRTPTGKKTLIIIGRKVAAVCDGSAPIPGSGFAICPAGECSAKAGDEVTYLGMEELRFGIQVGNSIIRDGVKTEKFISRFFNVKGISRIAFPPSLYPLDFDRARAARIAIGADREGKPVILWAEGAAKLGHKCGEDSCGASLSEMAEICEAVGLKNAVNLDGGGSAQILINNRRSLMISDRKAEDYSESERPVPMGLIVR